MGFPQHWAALPAAGTSLGPGVCNGPIIAVAIKGRGSPAAGRGVGGLWGCPAAFWGEGNAGMLPGVPLFCCRGGADAARGLLVSA